MTDDCMMCKGHSLKEVYQKILETINTEEWQIMYTGEGETEPAMAYTIGLTYSYNCPELIVFGLPPHIAKECVTKAVDIIKQLKPESNKKYQNIFKGFDAVFLPWEDIKILTFCRWFYQDKPFPVLMLVWPDEKNIFPFEENFNPELKGIQPIPEGI